MAYIGWLHRYEPQHSGAVGPWLCHQTAGAPVSEELQEEEEEERVRYMDGGEAERGTSIARGGDTVEGESLDLRGTLLRLHVFEVDMCVCVCGSRSLRAAGNSEAL